MKDDLDLYGNRLNYINAACKSSDGEKKQDTGSFCSLLSVPTYVATY